MSNILVSTNDDIQTKTLLMECLKTAGFKVINTEEGILKVSLPKNKLSAPEETKQTNTQESIFPSVPRLNEVFEFIELNYQHSIKLKEVAQAVGYSPAYLTDLVRRMVRIQVREGLTNVTWKEDYHKYGKSSTWNIRP